MGKGSRHQREVPKSRVRIDQRRWNRTLSPILGEMRADLGLPDGCRLKAELHSVLVYASGQFFVPHQDSEKSDAMVGTLTVTLPGTSRAGSLVVEHGDVRATYRSSDKLLSFVAFYSDCRHEVRPVRSGYRVVLTYNLLITGETASEIDRFWQLPPRPAIMDVDPALLLRQLAAPGVALGGEALVRRLRSANEQFAKTAQ